MRKCSICYKLLSNLKTHEKTVHGESRVNCDQCDYQTGQKVSLRRHQLAMHVGQKRECSYCGKKYKWEVDLRRHITSYHKDKTFSCNDCGKVFTQQRSFVTHRKSVHEKVTRKCNISKCDFQVPYGCYAPMTSHKWEKHGVGKSPTLHTCDHCDYSTTRVGDLKRHKNRLLKLKEYRCHNCDYKASVRHAMTKHMDRCVEIENWY